MMGYARLEVRDKKGIYDAVSEGLKTGILDLGIKGVEDVEYIQVYSFRGKLSSKNINRIARHILADKISQEYSCQKNGFTPRKRSAAHVVEVAYNPGVMDPVEESVLKAINDAGIKGVESVHTAKKYVITGKLSKKAIDTITEELLYNKTVQHVVRHQEEDRDIRAYKFRRVEIDVIGADDKKLKRISSEGQLYLSLTEMKGIKDYFTKLGRNPTDCELETLAQSWSEHCKHKTMMGSVKYNGKVIKNLLKETVMRATRRINKEWCVSVFKDNAGIIKFDSKYNICFKVETHNHPSALEPYGGAETGVGGVIRDCLGTGRGAKPILNTDVFCFGIPTTSPGDVPKGALNPKRVLKGVVGGVRDYGNKMGIPTVNGAVYFDARYMGNPLVFCGNVGIMPKEHSTKKVSAGDLIVVIGGGTGRDGIHGATFSSAELTRQSGTISGTAVQIGNPITEKKMLDTLITARDMGLYEAITDCGAGGFSSAVGEMGEDTGAEVYLERVKLKYKGLRPWEIWVSEAQERMVLAVKKKNLVKLLDHFKKENVEATVIGHFTNSGKLRIYYQNHNVADLDMALIHKGLPQITRHAVWSEKKGNRGVFPKRKKDYTPDLLKILSSWNVCSKEWIVRQYDHEVQGGSVLKPFVGAKNDGPSDASITRPLAGSNKGIALANGINPRYGDIDPYWMSASAIDEALRQIVAVGGRVDKTALLDNFCWGNTENPDQLGGLVRSSMACYDAAVGYGTPFISGKDSLNNEFNTGKKTISIPPTLLISAISVIDDVRKTISMDVKRSGSLIYVVGKTFEEFGGSQYFLINNKKGGMVPRLRIPSAKLLFEKLSSAIGKGLVLSAHDCSEGGIGACLAEMLFAGDLGAEVSLKKVPGENSIKRDDCILFSESNSRFIVEVSPDKKKSFEKEMKNIPIGFMGSATERKKLIVRGLAGSKVIEADIDDLRRSWKKPFEELTHERG